MLPQEIRLCSQIENPESEPRGTENPKSEPHGPRRGMSRLAQDADGPSMLAPPAQRPAASLLHSFSADSSKIQGTAREAESVSAVAQEACGASHTASRAGGTGAHPTCRPSQGPVGWDAPPRDPFRKTRVTACCRRCPWAAGHKWPCDQGGGLPGDRLKVVRWGNRAEDAAWAPAPRTHPGRTHAAPTPGAPASFSQTPGKWVSWGRPIREHRARSFSGPGTSGGWRAGPQ